MTAIATTATAATKLLHFLVLIIDDYRSKSLHYSLRFGNFVLKFFFTIALSFLIIETDFKGTSNGSELGWEKFAIFAN